MPISQVIEKHDGSNAKSRTPKQAAKLAHDNRTHGQRVYDSVNALNQWRRIDGETTSGPMDRDTGFGDDAIVIGKRGRSVRRRYLDVSPAA